MLGSMASSSDVEAARAQNDEENDGSRMHAVNDGVAISKQVLRIVVVGCSGVGKSSLLLTLTSGGVFPDYVPSVGGDYYFALRVDGVHRHVSMWDTQGDEAYDKLRPHAYRGADAILLCYSVGRESMRGDGGEESALRFWAAELRANCPRAPVVLCATKIDLRASHKKHAEGLAAVDATGGAAVARRIGAAAYVEVSALSNEGLIAMAEQATRVALDARAARGAKSKKCELV